MRANILATFERQSSPLDHFIGEVEAWEVVTRAWVTVEPPISLAQRYEAVEGQQVAAQIKYIVKTQWAPDLVAVNTTCRIRLTTPDGVERVLGVHSITNSKSANRELEFLCVEAG